MVEHLKIVMLVAHSHLVAEFCAAKMVSSTFQLKALTVKYLDALGVENNMGMCQYRMTHV
jgi:hypothetical protein